MDSRQLRNDFVLSDDAVAEIMAKEANDASIKYSSMGLEAFRSVKPSNKAKPNTRFLGRIIKETTSHNAALLAKEAAEAQARLDDLTEAEEKKRRRLNPSASDIRRRQLGDISSILEGRKRSSRSGHQDGPLQRDGARHKEKTRDHSVERDRRRSGHHEQRNDKGDGRRSHRQGHGPVTDERRHRRRRSQSPTRGDRRPRDRSPLSNSDEEDWLHHSRSHRRSRDQHRDLVGRETLNRKSYGRLRQEDEFSSGPSRRGDDSVEAGESSDPLDELIGPAPPPQPPLRKRGRGAIRGSAAMDGRFSEDYDPAADIQPEPAGTDDWDEAVEAYRDRQKWKQQGAERLRAAGLTDDQIRQWEKGGEKDIADVRWSKAGEKREWDRGKEVDGF